MSRVYFHSPSSTAELLGAEHAHAGTVTDQIGLSMLDPFANRDRLRELLNPDHDLARHRTHGEMVTWANWVATALRTETTSNPVLQYLGHPISGRDLLANTAIAVGSDPVRLLARTDRQVELHAYVEGPNRAWLAALIDQGLADGVMRGSLAYQPTPDTPGPRAAWPTRDLGWGSVAELLRARDDEPVVMSSSTLERFPNSTVADWEPAPDADLRASWADEAPDEWAALDEDAVAAYRQERLDELWSQLPGEQQWATALAGLRRRSQTMLLELSPDHWRGFRFGHCLTAFDLLADDYRARLDQALSLEPTTP